MNYTHYYQSPLGGITMASDGNALIGLWFDGQKYFADTIDKNAPEKSLPIFNETDRWLDIYFTGSCPHFTPPLKVYGTPFQKEVWKILLSIPFGKTMTYGEIANQIAQQNGYKKMSAQAVGCAVGHNSISLIIPCHRVIGCNGNLTGYAAGINRKRQLLALERKTFFCDTNDSIAPQ